MWVVDYIPGLRTPWQHFSTANVAAAPPAARRNWIRIPALIYGSFVVATMFPILAELATHTGAYLGFECRSSPTLAAETLLSMPLVSNHMLALPLWPRNEVSLGQRPAGLRVPFTLSFPPSSAHYHRFPTWQPPADPALSTHGMPPNPSAPNKLRLLQTKRHLPPPPPCSAWLQPCCGHRLLPALPAGAAADRADHGV